LIGFVPVTLLAGIRGVDSDTKIGSWDSDAVIIPIINAHIVSVGHVAFEALRTLSHMIKDLTVLTQDRIARFPLFLVKVMVLGVVLVRPVALETEVVPLLVEFKTVTVVTITTSDIPLVHLALGK
jgi:hypothetical protein